MIKINPAQKRSLQTSMWLLDEMLCIFEQYITKVEVNSILYEEVNALTEQQQATIINEINELRTLIQDIKDELMLEKHQSFVGKTIQSLSLHCITDNLFPLLGSGLSAYGVLHPDLSTFLNTRITNIIAKLETIAKTGYDSVVDEEIVQQYEDEDKNNC